MAKYEYTLLNMTHIRGKGMIAQESVLNKLGKDGWELAGIDGEMYIFKRKME
ncbi:MAG: DUF4177 domain-containing protein [Euryarchaeota archaeon]|nr:DUF4177 domain-containing protein [Euryarchaeota archaeon]